MSEFLLLLCSSIVILLSMLFSAAEISLLKSNPLQINVWKKQGKIFSYYSSNLIKEKDTTLILILIGINFSNVLASHTSYISTSEFHTEGLDILRYSIPLQIFVIEFLLESLIWLIQLFF